MKFAHLLAVGVAAASLTSAANAVVITSLYNTGVDNAGVATTGNGADQHWLLNGGVAFTGGNNGMFPIGPWLAETADARWLTPSSNAADSFDPASDGLYTYSLSFSLAGFRPGTASFTGRYAVDNRVESISLNGTQIAGPGGSFTTYTNFSSAGATFADSNLLTVVVRNFASASGNPTGLRVEFTATDAALAVPEPATWGLLIVGFAMTGVALRRRKSVAA